MNVLLRKETHVPTENSVHFKPIRIEAQTLNDIFFQLGRGGEQEREYEEGVIVDLKFFTGSK